MSGVSGKEENAGSRLFWPGSECRKLMFHPNLRAID
jgi:hypothetical protein